MSIPEPHQRLLGDVVSAGSPYGLVLAGGHALEAHGLLRRKHGDLDFATESAEAMEGIADGLAAALEARGRGVRVEAVTARTAQLRVVDPPTGASVPLALHKEAFWQPPELTAYGPALSLADSIGTKIRALYDRGAAVDLIDARAAAERHSLPELEALGRRHAYDAFDLPTLQSRLTGTDFYSDLEFLRFGLPRHEVGPLRAWAQHWSDDIAERLLEDGASPDYGTEEPEAR
ncbi:nucleotidyltransferase AbiEii toxin of type IV toxin-antitoxin system [Streptomyces sp. BK022]|uniref:nucleotidyl transferase AbiEii/AbiGii toxin family protein n=1 Tax=Streptomyces sp. BK022 TaxID=2512123 RepID=UPI001029816C|nr:nucleotidyl transferase AbiEii/AbiGii toxin family protein [Streptomyces sp. BK022]RZU30106.1 nucleotidyltransferase AbiEii toxin of type IV toxin-antitoxin system [Streptomyces sp. BK022]